ncbi:MAG TPA: hypothetical protein DCY12_07955 [Candidatus Atribacteria bacterium]|nr:hypothetical protein [Candidatus Atribacteria bacterium]
MSGVSGHVALITGGSRGIGRGISLRLARGGSKIVINYYQNENAAQETLEQIRSLGGEGIAFRADVSKKDQVKRMFEYIQENIGLVDILVNNAGEGQLRSKSTTTIDEEMWDRLYQVNIKGVFLCCAHALPMMIEKQWGRIINISSTAAITGGSSGSHYAATKGAIIPYSKALARDYASQGITVNVVAPGKIETDLFHATTTPEAIPQLIKKIPVGRLGRPDDIAESVFFFASEEAGFVTGQVMIVAGGYA